MCLSTGCQRVFLVTRNSFPLARFILLDKSSCVAARLFFHNCDLVKRHKLIRFLFTKRSRFHERQSLMIRVIKWCLLLIYLFVSLFCEQQTFHHCRLGLCVCSLRKSCWNWNRLKYVQRRHEAIKAERRKNFMFNRRNFVTLLNTSKPNALRVVEERGHVNKLNLVIELSMI